MSYTARRTTVRVAPPFQRRIRKVGAPLALIIVLGTVAGLIVIGLTAVNPVGTAIGFVAVQRGDDGRRARLPVAGPVGARTAAAARPRVPLGSIGRGRHLVGPAADTEAAINPGRTETVSPVSIVLGAPLTEEAAKGLFLLLMMTGRRRNELNSLTDCLVYAGLVGAGFAWLEDILYIGGGESVADSLLTAAMRLIMAPFAHSLFTTMFGIGVYFALQQRNGLAKAGCILLGYLGAVIMHGLWNGSSLLGTRGVLLVYVFWMVPIFVLAIVLGVASRRREQRVVAAKLPGMVAAGLVTPNEATWLGSIRDRKLGDRPGDPARRASPRQGGQELRRPGGGAGVRAGPDRSRLRRPAGDRAAERGGVRRVCGAGGRARPSKAGRIPRRLVRRRAAGGD